MTASDVLHLLKKKNKTGWQDWCWLKWRPIKNGTYNLYALKNYYIKSIGMSIGLGRNQGQYGTSWKIFTIGLDLIWWDVHFWIEWKIKANEQAIKESKELAKMYKRFPITLD